MIDENPSIQELMRHHGILPKKSLGQNFLFDEHIIQGIIEKADIKPDQTVLEIGAGPGNLTRALSGKAKRVVAIELDQRFKPLLEKIFIDHPNVEIIQADVLKLDLDHLMGGDRYSVVANLPYYITSAIIRKLLETSQKPARLALTMQKEVALRICAKPGEMSIMAVSVQVFGIPRIVMHIPAGAFFPPPKVDSSVLMIETYPVPLLPMDLLPTFFQLVKSGFSQKRKMLRNTISAGMHMTVPECEQLLESAGIDPSRRAQTLSIDEWHHLSLIYNGKKVVQMHK